MIVLDTHIWLWWVNEDQRQIKPVWQSRIADCDEVGVSPISCFEVAWLEHHGRIALPCPRTEWFEMALNGSNINLLPITPAVASCAASLTEHHRDPQDRIIIATAITHRAELISADSKFCLYQEPTGLLVN